MTDNEKLIEEAAKAMCLAAGDPWEDQTEHLQDWYRRDAHAALAVFEKAHAPTDDGREALIKSYEGWDFVEVALYPNGASRVIADLAQRLDAALRRPVPPAPGAPHCDGCAQFAHHHCYHCGKRAGLPHATFCPNFTDVEPQAEPTDAQVLAALNALDPTAATDDIEDWAKPNRDAMAAALRAAAETRGEGRWAM